VGLVRRGDRQRVQPVRFGCDRCDSDSAVGGASPVTSDTTQVDLDCAVCDWQRSTLLAWRELHGNGNLGCRGMDGDRVGESADGA